jgi:SAM-dependent methyltransferase
VARFYDTVRSGALSAAALAHGDADIGQECVLTPDEILALARRAGITAGTSVLDIGSGTGGPACYLAQQLGCRILGVDISEVGHAQALARARDAALSHLVQFQHGDIATLPLSQRLATAGVLGQLACIAEKPEARDRVEGVSQERRP